MSMAIFLERFHAQQLVTIDQPSVETFHAEQLEDDDEINSDDADSFFELKDGKGSYL
jgi:hypothetical protein